MPSKQALQIIALSLLLGGVPSAYAHGDVRIVFAMAWNVALVIASAIGLLLVRSSKRIKLAKALLVLLWIAVNHALWKQNTYDVGLLTLFISPLLLLPIAFTPFNAKAKQGTPPSD